jgi:hypothetical protein
MSCYFDIRHQIEFEANRVNKQVALSVECIRTKMFIRHDSSDLNSPNEDEDRGSTDTHNMYSTTAKYQIAASTVLRTSSGSKYEALDRLYRIPDGLHDDEDDEDEKNPEVFLSGILEHGLAKEEELESLLASGTWISHFMKLFVDLKSFITIWEISSATTTTTATTETSTTISAKRCPTLLPDALMMNPIIRSQTTTISGQHSLSVSFATTSLHHPFSPCSSVDEDEFPLYAVEETEKRKLIPKLLYSSPNASMIQTSAQKQDQGMTSSKEQLANLMSHKSRVVEEYKEGRRIAEHMNKLFTESFQSSMQAQQIYKTSYQTESQQSVQIAMLPLITSKKLLASSSTKSGASNATGSVKNSSSKLTQYSADMVVMIEHPILATTQIDSTLRASNTMTAAHYDRIMPNMLDILLFMIGLLVSPSPNIA